MGNRAKHYIAASLLSLLAVNASAADYTPVNCAQRQPYAGRPLHAAVVVPPPAVVPEAALNPARSARLDAALAAITARIIAPLGLKTLHALAPGGGAGGVAPLVSKQEKPIDPSWAGAAGPIVGSAGDMVRFWSALLDGRLISPSLAASMTTTLYPMFDPGTFYGLGTMVFDVPDGNKRILWIGHAGGTPGASALVVYSPADHAFAAVALTGDGSAVASVNLLLKAL